MSRNVKLYVWYYSLSSFLTWLPIFFLYFDDYLSLREIILLEALYYLSVVILEVPTGYFSDLIGRRLTLLIGAVLLVLAVLLYMIGGDFASFAVAQVAFAGFMAFTSGTNTVFHFESLKAEGLSSEYGDREAWVNKWSMIAGGLAALAGGLLGSYSLKLAYGLSLITALAALVVVTMFKEPDIETQPEQRALALRAQLRVTIKYLKIPLLRWIFIFYVFLFALIHVPYEFYQGYLALLDGAALLGNFSAPVVSGILYASTRFVSAAVAGKSMDWSRRFGFLPFLLGSMVVILGVVFLLGMFLHPILVVIILFRGASWAAVKAPINSVITPAIGAGQRATFHSMMSLACRLVFFLSLFGLSFLSEPGEVTDWPTLSSIFMTSFWLGFAALIVLTYTGRKKVSYEATNESS